MTAIAARTRCRSVDAGIVSAYPGVGLERPGRKDTHRAISATPVSATLRVMELTDVAVVVAEPIPAYELGVVSEIFGLPRIDPELPRYRFAVCAEERRPLRTTS